MWALGRLSGDERCRRARGRVDVHLGYLECHHVTTTPRSTETPMRLRSRHYAEPCCRPIRWRPESARGNPPTEAECVSSLSQAADRATYRSVRLVLVRCPL